MRFFSNDAKDNIDDETADRGPNPAEHTVPQQRAGSPWQHDTEPTPVGAAPQPTPVATAPQPTAVGTSSVSDAVAARAADDPERDDPERTDRLPDTSDRTVAFEDGATRDRDGDGDIDRNRADEGAGPAASVAAQGRTDAYREDRDSVVEGGGAFDDPHLTQPIPARTDEAGTPAEKSVEDKADDAKDQAEAAEKEAAEAKEQAKEQAEEQAEEAKTEPEPLIPAAVAPAPSGASTFFPTADTQPLRDRWRDVQLRFVDDPKGATSDAAGLVDEAVDKLVQGLRDQRGALAKGTDDTESLRVELRSYRDLLDRLLGL